MSKYPQPKQDYRASSKPALGYVTNVKGRIGINPNLPFDEDMLDISVRSREESFDEFC